MKTTKRKQGLTAVIKVELLTDQINKLDRIAESTGMSKRDIVANALQLWFNTTKLDTDHKGG